MPPARSGVKCCATNFDDAWATVAEQFTVDRMPM
jgi:hypothetical protein